MTHISKAHWTAIDKRHRLKVFFACHFDNRQISSYSNIFAEKYDSNKQNKISHWDVDIIVGAISSSVKVNWMVGLVCARRNCKDQQKFACTTSRQKKRRRWEIFSFTAVNDQQRNYNCHTQNVNFEIRKLCTRSRTILSMFFKEIINCLSGITYQ